MASDSADLRRLTATVREFFRAVDDEPVDAGVNVMFKLERLNDKILKRIGHSGDVGCKRAKRRSSKPRTDHRGRLERQLVRA